MQEQQFQPLPPVADRLSIGLPVRTDLRAGLVIQIEIPDNATVQTVSDTTPATTAAAPQPTA